MIEVCKKYILYLLPTYPHQNTSDTIWAPTCTALPPTCCTMPQCLSPLRFEITAGQVMILAPLLGTPFSAFPNSTPRDTSGS